MLSPNRIKLILQLVDPILDLLLVIAVIGASGNTASPSANAIVNIVRFISVIQQLFDRFSPRFAGCDRDPGPVLR